ncbi:oxidoreductase [Rhizobium sp. AC44/96]|uniref:Gfo/Idh/MocA family protein n=1 Tax=Rhizobium sp. AC44/96 TaxID=1841654 RepID=UPI00080FED9C|nr:Gfo/Idh/MocA family oxidoreductase [Rhizobium sp. AC44/96]OCJ05064.1 oxidoreductase [Rhizobium sp. AC44/96]
MKRLKIAVMGAGLIGKRHAQHVLAQPDAILTSIIDPSSDGRAFANEIGAGWSPSFAEIARDDRPDGVIVATPNRLHVENALEVIEARIPVLVEKPIADDVDEAAALVAAGERARLPILVGHHRRYNPMIQKAREILESGRLGRIIAVHGTFWVAKPDDYFDVAWRREPGAGPIFVNLIHDVDLFRYLFGEVDAVHAMQSSAVRGHAVEDTAVVSMRFANGILATLSASDAVASPWSWEMTTGENPSFPQQDQFCYQIGGTHGSLSIPHLDLWTNATRPDWLEPLARERVSFVPDDPLKAQLSHFCDVIRGDAEPIVSGREGLATLRVIEAIRTSALSGQMVGLDTITTPRVQ